MIQRSDESRVSRSFSTVVWIRLLAHEMYRYLLVPSVFSPGRRHRFPSVFSLWVTSSSSAPCAPPSLLASSIFLPNRWEFLLAHRFATATSRLGGERKGKEEGQEWIFVWLQVMIGSLFSLSFPCGLLGLDPKIATAIVGVKMLLLYSFSR
jgi:hypothetical protein